MSRTMASRVCPTPLAQDYISTKSHYQFNLIGNTPQCHFTAGSPAIPLHLSVRVLAGSDYSLFRQPEAAVVRDREEWIPRHLPRKSVWVGEVSRITAPERLLRRLQQRCSCRDRLCQNRIDFVVTARVTGERGAAKPFTRRRNIRI